MIQEVHASLASHMVVANATPPQWLATVWNPEGSNRILRLRRAFVSNWGVAAGGEVATLALFHIAIQPSGGHLVPPKTRHPSRRQLPIALCRIPNLVNDGTEVLIVAAAEGRAWSRVAVPYIATAVGVTSNAMHELQKPDDTAIEIPPGNGFGVCREMTASNYNVWYQTTLHWAENVDEDR